MRKMLLFLLLIVVSLSYASGSSSGASNPQAGEASAINGNLDTAAQIAANDEKGLQTQLKKKFNVMNELTFQTVSLNNCLGSGNCPNPADKLEVLQRAMSMNGPDVNGVISIYQLTKVGDQPLQVTKVQLASGASVTVSGSPPPTPTVEPVSFMGGDKALSGIAYAIEGVVYVGLTIYLFIVAWSRLLARDWFVFMIDMSLWMILSATMYVIFKGSL